MFPKVVMQNKYLIMVGLILIFFVALWSQYYFKIEIESFDVLPIQYSDFANTKLPPGYYKVDDTTMAKIPYGYALDPIDNSKIIPATNATKLSSIGQVTQTLNGEKVPIVPVPGKPIPDMYYLLNDTTLGTVPPNMMANVKSVNVSYSSTPPKLLVYYNTGYVSSTVYYKKTFPTPDSVKSVISASRGPPAAPPTMYFVDSGYKMVSFLPYGKIQNQTTGVGYIDDPNLISKTGQFDSTNTNFKDIANDTDINYHESAEDLMAKAKSSDVNFKYVNVKDQKGNVVKVFQSELQGTATYYQPGSFPFGASSYIPKYEDSVYLSRTTNESPFLEYTPLNGSLSACAKYKNLPAKNEEYCRSLDGPTCASTSCCVLLGGSKCVAGNETGPTYKNNYGDFLLRNKDSYFYNGKCYGNCA
jgi:hypothetical protein